MAKSYSKKCQHRAFATRSGQRIALFLPHLLYDQRRTQLLPGIPIWTVTLSESVRLVLLAICFSAIIYWVFNGTRTLQKKEITPFDFDDVPTHFFIYTISYVAIIDINCSWLTINIWHNAQHIGFVWLFNRKRYAASIEATSFLS